MRKQISIGIPYPFQQVPLSTLCLLFEPTYLVILHRCESTHKSLGNLPVATPSRKTDSYLCDKIPHRNNLRRDYLSCSLRGYSPLPQENVQMAHEAAALYVVLPVESRQQPSFSPQDPPPKGPLPPDAPFLDPTDLDWQLSTASSPSVRAGAWQILAVLLVCRSQLR